MFKRKLQIKIVLFITALVTQVSTVFAAPALQPQKGVRIGLALAASPGWIVSCQYSHSLPDDPIVAFRQPGASHLHDFVGAKTTDAFSTFSSLRAGGTTCAIPADASSYWVPALYEDGVRVLPNGLARNVLVYYRRKSAPTGTMVRPFPEGLRIIIGNAKAKSPQENQQLGKDIFYQCDTGTPLAAPPTQCASGIISVTFRFPNCWDGKNLDSPDHKSHMSYPASNRCPTSHPVVVPRMEAFFRYRVGAGSIGKITLSSGPYYTVHQDFFNAWEPAVLQKLVMNCINAMVDCGKNPSVSGMNTNTIMAANTLMPTITAMPTRTVMPTKTPTRMATNTPLPMPTNTLASTPTSEPPPTNMPTDVPTDIPIEIPPTAEPTQPVP